MADKYIPACAIDMRRRCLCERQTRRLTHVMEGRECCLVEVAILECRLPPSSMLLLAKSLNKNDSLRVLRINWCCLDDDHVMFLSQGLLRNVSLSVVDLSHNNISHLGAAYLCGGLGRNKGVRSLNLDHNFICNKGALRLARLLKPTKKEDQKEDQEEEYEGGLMGNSWSAGNKEEVLRVRESVRGWEGVCLVNKLSLRHNGIKGEGTTSIFKSLRSNLHLRELDLSENETDLKSIEALSTSLLINRSLQVLRLESCELTSGSCEVLKRALKTNTDLKLLNLDLNDISDEGVEHVCEALKLNRSLQELSLNFCAVTEVGLDLMASCVRLNSSLKCVKLCYNDIYVGGNDFEIIDDENDLENIKNYTFPNKLQKNEGKSLIHENNEERETIQKQLNALKALDECLHNDDLQLIQHTNNHLSHNLSFYRHKSFKRRLFMAFKTNTSFRIII